MIFTYFHDWKNEYSIKIDYETNIYESNLLYEQRIQKRGRGSFLVSFSVTAWLLEVELQKFLKVDRQTLFDFPIEIEKIQVQSINGNRIVCYENLSKFFFLNYLSDVLLINVENNESSQVMGVYENEIVLETPMTKSNYVYTGFKGFIKNISLNHTLYNFVQATFEIKKLAR